MKAMKWCAIIVFCFGLLSSIIQAETVLTPPQSGPAVTNGNVLFAFDAGTEEWKSHHGSLSNTFGPDNRGFLVLSYDLQATSDTFFQDTFESPEINEDFTGLKEIQMTVSVPQKAPRGLKAEVFVKVGPNWQWVSSGWSNLKRGKTVIISLDVSKIPSSFIADIKNVGIQIGKNKKHSGQVMLHDVVLR